MVISSGCAGSLILLPAGRLLRSDTPSSQPEGIPRWAHSGQKIGSQPSSPMMHTAHHPTRHAICLSIHHDPRLCRSGHVGLACVDGVSHAPPSRCVVCHRFRVGDTAIRPPACSVGSARHLYNCPTIRLGAIRNDHAFATLDQAMSSISSMQT
jgi:hypothetical protein